MSEADRQISGVISGHRHVEGEAMLAQARRAAAGFRQMGIQPGEAVALLLRNDIAFFVATLGAQAAEAYPVPINWHGKSEDVAYVLRDCRARVIVAHADLAAVLTDAVPKHCRVLVVATPPEVAAAYRVAPGACLPPPGAVEWEAWLAAQSEHMEPPRSARGSIVYTSGTTGRPKGVVRAPAEGAAQDRMYGIVDEIFGVPRGSPVRTVVTGPLYHPAPNFTGMRAVEPGSLAVLQPKFDELDLLEKIQRYRITHLNMVPTMFIRLLRLEETMRRRFDVSSLQRVTHAAAPCPVEVKQAMIDWWGPVIWEFYGGTETGCVAIHGSEEALHRPGTVGRPLARPTRWVKSLPATTTSPTSPISASPKSGRKRKSGTSSRSETSDTWTTTAISTCATASGT
jgi:long-chain acyl-CoA synthetase